MFSSVTLVTSSVTVFVLLSDWVPFLRDVFTLSASWLRVLVLVPSVMMLISFLAVLVKVLLLLLVPSPSFTDSEIFLVVMVRSTFSPTLSVMDSEALLSRVLASLVMVPPAALRLMSFAFWLIPVIVVPSVTALLTVAVLVSFTMSITVLPDFNASSAFSAVLVSA